LDKLNPWNSLNPLKMTTSYQQDGLFLLTQTLISSNN